MPDNGAYVNLETACQRLIERVLTQHPSHYTPKMVAEDIIEELTLNGVKFARFSRPPPQGMHTNAR